ncbi:uncharacterized protein [Anoplolepis gracilipes]|uniref:uncharacterized protein n=1 Tax=Anoplolepis gracilipes TaxID=354296 RepID=UPI003B9F954A
MGKRKHRADSEDEFKENRLVKKIKRLLKDFKRHKDRLQRKRSSSREMESKEVGRKRLRSFKETNLEDLSQSPSRSPPRSLRDTSPSIYGEFSQELTEDEGLTSNHSQDPPNNTIATSAENTIRNQPIVSGVEAPSEIQKTDIPSQEEGTIVEDLNLEILEAIGKRVAEDRVLAPAIPKSIAVRLEDILKKGLPKKEREKLLKEHVPPKNCVLIDPPKLNEEIKVSIGETSTKRDDRIMIKQKKITACLALLGGVIVDVINNKQDEKLSLSQITLVKKLSEAARLLADLQRNEILTRRSLILAAISSSQKDTLEEAKADEWLFGQKLGETLKAAKSIERSGKELKAKLKNTKRPKNSKVPPRRQPFKARMSGGFRNKNYRNQSNKKDWGNQSGGDRNNSQSQMLTQKKT